MKTMATQTIQHAGLLLISAALFYSCSPVLYSTVGQNVPMFTQAGEVAVSAGYANSSNTGADEETTGEGMYLQGATSINESWAVMGSYYHIKNNNTQGWPLGASSDFNTKGDYLEGGFGKYGLLKNQSFAYEVFAGLGYGQITNKGQTYSADVGMLKPFVQPSIGYISKYVDLILTPRIGFNTYISHESSDQMGMDAFLNQNNNKFLFEPGVTVRGGYKNVKIQVQYNYSTFKGTTVYTFDGQTASANTSNQQFISIGIYALLSDRYVK